ncbi:AhpD-like protein [Aspergillus keveii]|uniref:AhpD-like protein n=1 Tax=Aspergillus keveii TaxID=714993 RepID=A0ABR4G9J1_9EURO
MSRYPPIPQDAQTPEQQRVEAGARKILARVPDHVQLTGPSGALLGPYSSLPYTPDLITPWMNLATAIDTQPGLSAKEKELSTLATLSEYNAPYILYAHSAVALEAGLSRTQIDDAKSGRTPAGLTDTEAAVYVLALEMARSRGPIPDRVFGPAVDVLGREKVARIAHVVGGFGYVALLATLAAKVGVEVVKD